MGTPRSSLHNPPTTDGTGYFEPGEEIRQAQSDMAWPMNVDGRIPAGPTSEPRSLEPRGHTRTESDSCSCLLSSISFLEKLVSRSASRENRIDLLLRDVRGSIRILSTFMACERCAAQVEQNILLAMAAQQISVICEKTANCYESMHVGDLDGTNSATQTPEANSTADPVDICVSTYRVSRRERQHMLKSLVTLQISELQQHISTIESRYRKQPNQGQAKALNGAKNHIKLAQVAISSQS